MDLRGCKIKGKLALSRVTCGGEVFLGAKDEFDKSAPTVLEGQVTFNETMFHQAVSFRETAFQETTYFRNTQFLNQVDSKKTRFAKSAHFDTVLFAGKVSFKEAEFLGDASMVYVRFLNLASFLGTRFHGKTTFLNSQFHDEALFNFDRNTIRSRVAGTPGLTASGLAASLLSGGGTEFIVVAPDTTRLAACFASVVDFTNVRFHKRAVFEDVVFQQDALFPNAYFGEQAAFQGATFAQTTTFERAYCNHELELTDARFAGSVSFDYANINRRLNLTGASFSSISFYGASTDMLMVERHQIEGKLKNQTASAREPEGDLLALIERKMKKENMATTAFDRAENEYILMKESFARRGMQEEEDWAYRQKKIMERKASSWIARRLLKGNSSKGSRQPGMGTKLAAFWRLGKNGLAYLVIDKGTGYGTQPFRVALLAVFLIFVFGVFYAVNFYEFLRADGAPLVPSQALYFSMATFTTMGASDILPRPDGYMKFIVALEAFLGIFITTLFVGTYVRKIIR
jgi:uncharacterized protein YjbI with pentapeptide repeats